MVSAVVKVFEITTTSDSSGSIPSTVVATFTGSTLERKRRVAFRASIARRLAWGSLLKALSTKFVPRYEPPMPTMRMLRRGRPVAPTHEPSRTREEKSSMRSRTSWTRGTTFTISSSSSPLRGDRFRSASPAVCMMLKESSLDARRAIWRAARCSVGFTGAPETIAKIFSRRFAFSARSRRSFFVSIVIFCREKSMMNPSFSRVKPSTLSLSWRRSRRCGNPDFAWSSSACHSSVLDRRVFWGLEEPRAGTFPISFLVETAVEVVFWSKCRWGGLSAVLCG
mmetsp:Transcript_27760/g.38778  ORF Transcript_27760/g.38778 Transcript_27760/m.38778 type:complete len:281 (-) Transcript_27760:608-1450(-)